MRGTRSLPEQSARLSLRRTQIPGAGPDDWSVMLDGEEIIGRIYRAANLVPVAWFWGLNTLPSSAANSGYAPSLDEAKARFREGWTQAGQKARRAGEG